MQLQIFLEEESFSLLWRPELTWHDIFYQNVHNECLGKVTKYELKIFRGLRVKIKTLKPGIRLNIFKVTIARIFRMFFGEINSVYK